MWSLGLAGLAWLACQPLLETAVFVDITPNLPVARQIEIARNYATADQLERLRHGIRVAVPAIDDRELDRMTLSWRHLERRSLTGRGNASKARVQLSARYWPGESDTVREAILAGRNIIETDLRHIYWREMR